MNEHEFAYMIISPKGKWLLYTIRENEVDCKNQFSFSSGNYDWSFYTELGYTISKIKLELDLIKGGF